jgi:hypothetical protein
MLRLEKKNFGLNEACFFMPKQHFKTGPTAWVTGGVGYFP